MSSFFGKLRGSAGPLGPSLGTAPAKKDVAAPQPTPLDKLLESAGPIRSDGSDKFFGMENFGNTCYCNSILQCLYYSVPFREQVIQYPVRSSPDSLKRPPNGHPRQLANGAMTSSAPNGALSPTRIPGTSPGSPLSRKSPQVPSSPGQPGNRPEDKPDTPEYKKKHAMLAGPILSMDYENAASYDMPESLFTSLKDIFEAIVVNQSRSGVVSPQKFLENLKRENEMFRTSMHQDAHEFLNLLLNEVVENVEANTKKQSESRALENGQGELNGNANGMPQSLASVMASAVAPSTAKQTSGNTDWVHELFEGTLTSETKCLTCENVSQRDEAFLDLSVDLDQHSSVTSCLKKFSEEEMLCERNKFHCDNCGGLQEAEKRMKIKRLPRILALHLKRFKYTEDLQRLQKLFHRVVYPYHLRLFNTTEDAEDPDRIYELYAVVVHIGGGPYHGHYVAIIKTEGRGWLLFDDEMVEPVDKSYVRNFFGDRPGLACAYVLFYQETTVEAVRKEQEAENVAAAQQSQSAKDGAELKPNGLVANGLMHPVPTYHAQMDEEEGSFSSLDHAATAPIQSPLEQTHPFVAEAPVTSPPVLVPSPKKGDVKSKKERAEEEKKQKQADKEREKAEKQRARSLELKRKDYEKKQKEEIKAATAASKHTKAEEDTRAADTADGSQEMANGGTTITKSGSLNRFRPSRKSISISRKPKFWTSKGKDESPKESKELLNDVTNVSEPGPEGTQGEAPAAVPDMDVPEKNENSKQGEKVKGNLFGLKKKSSALFP